MDEGDAGRKSSEELETLDQEKIRVTSIDVNESNPLDQQIIKPRPFEFDKANNSDISSNHDAWEEEIQRLQMYLSSPQSKMPHTRASNLQNVQPVENTHAYGTGEDVGVLGSTLTARFDNDEGDTNLASNRSFSGTQTDTSSTSPPSSKCDEEKDMSHDAEVPITNCHGNDSEIHQITENESMLAFDQTETKNIGRDRNVDYAGAEAEVYVDVRDAFDKHNDEIDVGVAEDENIPTEADEGRQEGTTLDTLENKTTQAGLKSPGTNTTHDSSSNFVALTDSEEYIDDACNELERDSSEVTVSWESAPPIAESNKLVEEGLRKLRRKNGDQPSVPYVITRAMKRVLVDELGYDEQEVQSMRPDVAVVVVSENLQRPSVSTLPSRFYHEDITSLTTNELPHQVGLQHKIRSFVERLDFKQSAIMLGSILAVSFSLVSKVNRVANELPKKYENDKNMHQNVTFENTAGIESFDASNEAVSQSDLDRTWLERLISMLTFFK